MAPNQAFRCTTCSQTFSRNEHLQRHQVTHYSNSVRPFQCKFCPDTFTRSDVLKRHESTHRRYEQGENSNTGQPGQGQGIRSRPRTSVACDNCAKAKIRCNGIRPCERCKTRSLECTLQRPHTVLKRRMPSTTAEGSNGSTNVSMAYSSFDTGTGVNGHLEQNTLPNLENSIIGTDREAPEELLPLQMGEVEALPPQNSALGPQYQHSIDETVVFGQNNAGIDLNGMNGVGNSEIDFNNQTYELPQSDLYLGFDAMNPSAVFDFPTDLWFQDPSPEVVLSPESVPIAKDRTTKPAKDPKSFGISTHANSPFFHVLDSNASLSLKVNVICDFFNNEPCWKQISEVAGKPWENDKQPEPIINPQTRDALLAVTYLILSGRLEQALPRTLSFRFPPLETIQCLFSSCFGQFLRMYPFIHPSSFDVSTQTSETSITYPLFLQNIMIMGALLVPNKDARAFAIELAYVTRRAMHDTVIRDPLSTDDVWMLSATILITAFGAWSGNKRHTEIAEGYRGQYTVMFNRRGYLRPQRRQEGDDELANDWRKWISRERKRRLFHVWYIFEQEISMLNCIPSHVYFTDMRGTMPGPDAEYFADSEIKWRKIREEREKTKSSPKVLPPSLAALYWLFLRDDFLHLDVEITPLQLRLLQCAIQTQVIQYAQTARFVNVENILPGGTLKHATTSHSTTFAQLRHEELQGLLVRWYVLRKRILTPSTSPELAIACTLMYHLASMELYICFDDVQLLAGKHGLAAGKDILPHFQRWAKSPASMKAIAHAGQVVRTLQKQFVNQDQDFLCPLWWPVAVSRVALLFWSFAVVDAVTKKDNAEQEDITAQRTLLISINDTNDEVGPHGKLIQHSEGTPCLTNFDGILVPLDQIADVVTISLEILDKGMSRSTPLCDGVHQFLQDIRRCGNPYLENSQDK